MKETTIKIAANCHVEITDTDEGKIIRVSAAPPSLRGILTTFKDVCHHAEEDIEDYETDSTDLRDVVLNQIKRVMLITEVFNQGKKVKMDDPTTGFWRPVFNHTSEDDFRFVYSDCTLPHSVSVLGPDLSFSDRNDSDYVGKTFQAEFKLIHFPK